MKKLVFSIFFISLLASSAAGHGQTGQQEPASEADTLCYVLGLHTGDSFRRTTGALPFDLDALAEGMQQRIDGIARLSDVETGTLLSDYFTAHPEFSISIPREKCDSIMQAPGFRFFESEEERNEISYAIGAGTGRSMMDRARYSTSPDDSRWFRQGLEDGFAEQTGFFTMPQANEWLQTYFTVTLPAHNKAENDLWLAGEAKQRGVRRTPSGLLYRIDKKGSSKAIARDDRDRVVVHYTGWNHRSEQFDSSYDRGDEPADFPLINVIAGWTEGLKLVGKGGRITLWIPAELAYGEKGAGGVIQPNSALKFEIEVVDVIPHEEE